MRFRRDSNLAVQMLERFGPTMGGQDLYSVLGFRTYAAFHRSKERQEIGVKIFKIPGRRGWFALTSDIANWLGQLSDSSSDEAQLGGKR